MPDDEKDSPPAETPYLWQKKRVRPGRAEYLVCPWTGFGPMGENTLFVPSATIERRIRFSGGRPSTYLSAPLFADHPELEGIRRKFLATFETDPLLETARGDLSFYDYAAAVLGLNYALTDPDLEYLFCHSSAWHQDVMNHLLGGREAVEILAEIAPRTLSYFAPRGVPADLYAREVGPVPPPEPIPIPPPAAQDAISAPGRSGHPPGTPKTSRRPRSAPGKAARRRPGSGKRAKS